MFKQSRRLAGAVVLAAAASLFAAQPASAASSSSLPHLNYYGGRVLTNVKVDVVVWGSWTYPSTVKLTGTRSISSFFRGITASRYVDWLTEYNTPTQRIGHGTLDGVFVVHPPSADNGANITNTQIHDGVHRLIASGALPKPDGNRLYALFFRSGQVVYNGQSNSARDFCAYHDTITYGGKATYLADIPYELSQRACKPATTSFDDVTTVVSHELIEAITDPGVALRQLSWYDPAHGEIADICAHTSVPGAVTGGDGVRYIVQREWSNRVRACILTR